MKIKGTIEDLKLKKLKKRKNDHKNISRTYSGVVVSIVGSVHFWLVPWSGLYTLRSIGPFLCSREKAMASHSSTLAWKIPWTEEPGRPQSMGS